MWTEADESAYKEDESAYIQRRDQRQAEIDRLDREMARNSVWITFMMMLAIGGQLFSALALVMGWVSKTLMIPNPIQFVLMGLMGVGYVAFGVWSWKFSKKT